MPQLRIMAAAVPLLLSPDFSNFVLLCSGYVCADHRHRSNGGNRDTVHIDVHHFYDLVRAT